MAGNHAVDPLAPTRNLRDGLHPAPPTSRATVFGNENATRGEYREMARSGRRNREGRLGNIPLRPFKHTVNPFPPMEPLSADQIEAIHLASLRVLAEHGMRVHSARAREVYRAAGNRVDESEQMVYLDPGYVQQAVAQAPSQYTYSARNPARSLTIGGNHINFAPVGGPSFVSDLDRGRRAGTFDELCDYVRLIQMLDILHMASAGSFEPLDLPVDTRHLDRAYAATTLTDKVHGTSLLGAFRARDALTMACMAHGIDYDALADSGEVIIAGGINTNSPRQLDEVLTDGMLVLVEAGQPIVVTPFTLLGAMAPVTIAGALTLANAEALAVLALIQTVRPGAPMVYGGFTSNVDMKSGAPAFGTPEYVKATLGGAQMARRYKLPFRSSNTNASNVVDAQAAYESEMSIWAAVMGHTNVIVHAAGWLEGGLVASFEKLIIDAEMLQMMAESLEPVTVDAATLAVDAIGGVEPGGHFFGSPHTLERYETAFYPPIVSDWRNFETWEEAGSLTATQRANTIWKQMLNEYVQPPIDPAIDDALKDFVARRKREITKHGTGEEAA